MFDRTEDAYLPISILLEPPDRDLLDTVLRSPEGFPLSVSEWEAAIDTYAEVHHLASSTRAKLRIACFFWNGTIRLTYEDARYFDMENRERFVLAMRAFLDLPHNARVVLIVPTGELAARRAG
jgi:hypothetical protein